jgi:hypothetical protein
MSTPSTQYVRIEPVDKHTAPPEIRQVLDDVQSVMGIPWPPANWRCYAMYPAAMLRLWDRMRFAVNTGPFLGDAIAIADHAARSMDDWYRPAFEPDIPHHDVHRVQWELDAFNYGNPQLLIEQAALSRALRGEVVGSTDPIPEAPRQPSPYRHGQLHLVSEEEASIETRALYDDIKRTLNVPIVNSDYQAMAKWPAFLHPAWEDIKPYQERDEFRALSQRLARMADEGADRLHPAVEISTHELHESCGSDEQWDNLRQMVQMFTDLLPGLIINVAMLRIAATPRA